MTIQELQNRFLLTKKITAVDFFVLLMAVTKKEKAYLFAHPEYRLMMKEQKNIVSFFTRRMKHEPVAYIIGQKEFIDDTVILRDMEARRQEPVSHETLIKKLKHDIGVIN